MKIGNLAEYTNRYLAVPVISTISPDDQMFSGDRASYFAIDESAINAILPAVNHQDVIAFKAVEKQPRD